MPPPPEALAALGVLRRQDVAVTPALRHHELFTWDGLLTILWHGDPSAAHVVLACGGALGSLLGPADGAYHDLGLQLAGHGVGTMRIGYRRPNDLDACVQDLLAAAELAARQGAERFVVVGHSFGGAVAVQAGVLLGDRTAGVVTLATQSAGCEEGAALEDGGVPVLLIHGEKDDILPYVSSQMVQMICGGELVILPGAGHALTEAHEQLRRPLAEWIRTRFDPA